MRLRLLAVALPIIIVACQAFAAPVGQQQYIVKTKHLTTKPHTKAAPSVQDVIRASGGHIDYEWRDRLVVTLPDSSVQALVQHPAVEFVQKVVSGSPDAATAPTATTSAEPVVTSAAFHPAPKSFPAWSSGTYSYDGQGNITSIGSNAYSYDAFSRLATSTTNGIPETYTYDRYGNLTQKVTGTGSTALTVQNSVDDGNHLSAHCYDKGGNLTDDDPVHCPTATETYSFDALNRMTLKWNHTTHTKEYYIYNANDERIAVIPCSETACTEQITFSFRDESGKVLRQFEVPYQQFDSPWTWVEDYVYRDGVLLAAERVPAQGGRRYFHTDHLGTPRLVTDSNGRRISEHDYFPFGVEVTPLRQDTLPVNGFNREEPMKFTGHERDFSGGTSFENSNYIDYMHARSTVPQWGRFLSVDPMLNVKRARVEPQRWNRYSYVVNSPINKIDPDGREDPAEMAALLGQAPDRHSLARVLGTPEGKAVATLYALPWMAAGGGEVSALSRVLYTAFPRTVMALMGIGGGMTGAPSVNLGSGARPIVGSINVDNMSSGFRGSMQQIQVAGDTLALPFKNGSIGNVTAQNFPSMLLGQGGQQLAGELGRTMQSGSILTITTQTPGALQTFGQLLGKTFKDVVIKDGLLTAIRQ